MSTITLKDGTTIYYKDWGKGPVVTFSHGWPLNSDSWDGQMLFLAENGFRVVAHDRRGHGRLEKKIAGATKACKSWAMLLMRLLPLHSLSPNRTVAARLHLCRQTEGSGCMCRNRDALLQSEVQ